jgi:hypothetical protein
LNETGKPIFAAIVETSRTVGMQNVHFWSFLAAICRKLTSFSAGLKTGIRGTREQGNQGTCDWDLVSD